MATTTINDKFYDSHELPDYVKDTELSFTDNSIKVLEKRYLRKDADGAFLETPAGMFYRVAHVVGSAWPAVEERTKKIEQFYNLIAGKQFFPNSPTFTGAGTPLGQLAACFVLPLNDDMGKENGGIFDTLRNAALIQQTGGGNGFAFSRLRPKGDLIKSSGGIATGPVGFLEAYDSAFGVVSQGGTRRGANMAVLRVDHPDIEDFIECKAEEGKISNFNVSVAITDEFMGAVDAGVNFDLINPRDGSVWKSVDARALFDKIIAYAHRNGEPGVLFIDRANRDNPVPHLYELEATNPCGEQWLGPYENCCLGSINLSNMVDNGKINWRQLEEITVLSAQFLDCVVTANNYVPAVPQLREAALKARRIGLGIMGLADMMYKLGIRYGSDEGQELAMQVMEFVRFHALQESVRLAKRFDEFPEFQHSIYTDGVQVRNRSYTIDTGRPILDWYDLSKAIFQYGLRNAAQTTVAPTGTIATVVGCEGYGCEPVFALGYTRHVKDGDKDMDLIYTSPLFEQAVNDMDLLDEQKAEILKHAATYGTIQDCDIAPQLLKDVFVVSGDITAEEHVRMQAALQMFVDNSISKTCNFPEGATKEDVANAYRLAWELGCKGLTVYVTGSREQVVLETAATKSQKTPTVEIAHTPEKQPRPTILSGHTYKKATPIGTAYITVNDANAAPVEVFINVGKAGSEVSAVSEALGRLCSLVLRMQSPVPSAERVNAIVDELIDIGGSRPLGFGANRVRSLPDGVAQVLRNHMHGAAEAGTEPQQTTKALGDICPDCGEASFLNVEGCRKCMDCGYSEC